MGTDAAAFTRFLAERPEVLADVLGFEVDLQPVGDDTLVGVHSPGGQRLACTLTLDGASADVGRLLELAARHDATTVVWLAPLIDDSTRAALEWLDRRTDESTHVAGMELRFMRIGDSPPAPWLNLVAGATAAPSLPDQRDVDPTPDPLDYREFWEACRERISAEHPRWTRTRTVPADAVFTTSTGLPGLSLQMVAEPKGPQVQLLADGPDTRANAARVDRVMAARSAFESEVDAPLSWPAPDSDDGVCVRTRTDHLVDLADPGTWPAMVTWLIRRQQEFRRVLEQTGPAMLALA